MTGKERAIESIEGRTDTQRCETSIYIHLSYMQIYLLYANPIVSVMLSSAEIMHGEIFLCMENATRYFKEFWKIVRANLS